MSFSPKARPRVRQLSPEEAALWGRVTATIQPLSREKIKLERSEKEQQSSDVRPLARQPRLRPVPADVPIRPRLGTTLDSTWDRRLRSGTAEPDRVLDLHGMTLDSAWRAIDRGLELARKRSFRNVTSRQVGEVQSGSHLRSGRPGEWRDVFTQRHKDYFKEVAGDLLISLGYERDSNW